MKGGEVAGTTAPGGPLGAVSRIGGRGHRKWNCFAAFRTIWDRLCGPRDDDGRSNLLPPGRFPR